jgi:hypothetical protein
VGGQQNYIQQNFLSNICSNALLEVVAVEDILNMQLIKLFREEYHINHNFHISHIQRRIMGFAPLKM